MTISKKPKLLSAGHPDNFQTDPTALDDIIPYLPPAFPIWEPACGKGNLVRGLKERGYEVTGTDILDGTDFLENCPFSAGGLNVMTIVSNPPFSKKQHFLGRCYQLGRPFALLMPITTFDSKERRRLFHENGIQIIMPNRRYNFETPNGKGSSSWFYTAWFCWKFNLPSQIVFAGFEGAPRLQVK